jgi:hypothetical protein
MMAGTLGLVLLLMTQAADPKNWYWMWGGKPPVEPAGRPVDTRIALQGPGEAAEGEFILRPPDDPPSDEAAVPTVDRELLAHIKDDTIIRGSEAKVFYTLLSRAARMDFQSIRAESAGEVEFRQLFQQSDEFRGRAVTVRGTARRAHQLQVNANESGIDAYWEVWVFPDDHPVDPIVVCSARIPEGFPAGMQIEEQVELTGYFFKRWAYRARDTLRTTPLVIAGDLAWTPAVAPASGGPTWQNVLVWLVGAALAAFGVVVWVNYRMRRPAHEPLPARISLSLPEEGDEGT